MRCSMSWWSSAKLSDQRLKRTPFNHINGTKFMRVVCCDGVAMFSNYLALTYHPLYSESISGMSACSGRKMPEQLSQLLISLLGMVRVAYQSHSIQPEQRGPRMVLAWLALKDGHHESRDRLASALWPDKSTSQARSNLRQALYQLRKQMEQCGYSGLLTTRISVALEPGSFSTDLDDLLHEIASKKSLPERLERTPSLPRILMADLSDASDTFNDWILSQRIEFEQRLRSALVARLNDVDTEPLRQQLARALLALNPGDEHACRLLMQAYAEAGEIGSALQQYNSLWSHLAEEYDVEPSEATQQLAVTIKLGESDNTSNADMAISTTSALDELHDIPNPESVAVASDAARQYDEYSEIETGLSSPIVLWLEVSEPEGPDIAQVSIWSSFLQQLAQLKSQSDYAQVLHRNGCRLILQYQDCQRAVQAALDLRRRVIDWQKSTDSSGQVQLRIVLDKLSQADTPNVLHITTAKLIRHVEPGDVLASVEVVEHLTHGIDADIEDVGDLAVNGGRSAVRLFKLIPASTTQFKLTAQSNGNLKPTIAVIPFSARNVGKEHLVLGEILADEVIASLSFSPDINIISRLSTSALRDRKLSAREIGDYLNANYIVYGVYYVASDRITLDVELADAITSQVVWSERLRGNMNEFLAGSNGVTESLVNAILAALMRTELQRAFSAPLPTLRNYTLLVAAVALMHRNSLDAFNASRKLLDALIDRASHFSAPYAWLGKWYVLRTQQGWSLDPEKDGRLALECTKRALENNPASSLAYTINGIVHTNLLKNLDDAKGFYETALEYNPNESMAWLLKGTLHAFKGEGDVAVVDTKKALSLTPLDPLRYFYLSLSSTAALANRDFDGARSMALQSLRLNRTHTSTLRVLAIAQWNLGRQEEAQDTVKELLRLEPDLTITDWLRRSPSAPYTIGTDWARAMMAAGVPA